jgi:hypothetical protein
MEQGQRGDMGVSEVTGDGCSELPQAVCEE